ncbi:GNAT family N-acetyltransferase [Paenibacillus faecalis]|uniref:GNAT family N-acetyltransferase n=1 Tax=Paenibacillus faecalis TaxID=2079532 RepID=UPI00131A58BC
MIRSITLKDADEFLRLQMQLDEETSFMLYEPGERSLTKESQEQRIKTIMASGHSMIFVVEAGDRLVGYIGGFGSALKRVQHSLYIVIGILQEYSGQRIGTRLFQKLETWAYEREVHRLELTVMSHNERAISLYRSAGFEVEGIKKHSLVIEGQYIDEYYMSKLLSD